jgi:hypothetical protein
VSLVNDVSFNVFVTQVNLSLTNRVSLGTVFAVTGGLAAPALAAGIGGLASLTGAGTASSTAILAVLATFKAGKFNSYFHPGDKSDLKFCDWSFQ